MYVLVQPARPIQESLIRLLVTDKLLDHLIDLNNLYHSNKVVILIPKSVNVNLINRVGVRVHGSRFTVEN